MFKTENPDKVCVVGVSHHIRVRFKDRSIFVLQAEHALVDLDICGCLAKITCSIFTSITKTNVFDMVLTSEMFTILKKLTKYT